MLYSFATSCHVRKLRIKEACGGKETDYTFVNRRPQQQARQCCLQGSLRSREWTAMPRLSASEVKEALHGCSSPSVQSMVQDWCLKAYSGTYIKVTWFLEVLNTSAPTDVNESCECSASLKANPL